MIVTITPHSVVLELSEVDTYQWQNRPGSVWPCATLRNCSLKAGFDATGLLELDIWREGELLELGGDSTEYVDGSELNAMTSDFLKETLSPFHPCYYVTVGQFLDRSRIMDQLEKLREQLVQTW